MPYVPVKRKKIDHILQGEAPADRDVLAYDVTDGSWKTDSTFSADLDAVIEAMGNLADAQGAISNGTVGAIGTTEASLDFVIDTDSTDTSVFTFDASANTMTLLKEGSYNFTSTITIESSTNSAVDISFILRDINSVQPDLTQVLSVEIANKDKQTFTINTLYVVPIGSSPVTIEVIAIADIVGMSLFSFSSLLVSMSVSGSVADHSDLTGTTSADSHPTSAITGLDTALGTKMEQSDIDTAINNLVDTAPGALDTLNELAAALGDDPNFATTVTNSLATKCGAHATAHDSCYVNCSGGNIAGILNISSTSDSQLNLSSTDGWTGIGFNDSGANNDNIWHCGSTGTFAIGGGGASAAGKKLHVDGGMSIGTNVDSTVTPTNGLLVEGCVSSGCFTGNATTATTASNSSGTLSTCLGTKCGAHATAHDSCYLRCSGGSVTGSITTCTSGGTQAISIIDAPVNVWKYTSLRTAGVTKWDIATNEADCSGALQFRSAGSPVGAYVATNGNIHSTGFIGNATTATTASNSSGALSTCLGTKCASHTHSYCASHTHTTLDSGSTSNVDTLGNTEGYGKLMLHCYSSGATGGVGATDNANAVLTAVQHVGGYTSQLSFSSDGRLYHRDNPGAGLGTWKKIVYDTDTATLACVQTKCASHTHSYCASHNHDSTYLRCNVNGSTTGYIHINRSGIPLYLGSWGNDSDVCVEFRAGNGTNDCTSYMKYCRDDQFFFGARSCSDNCFKAPVLCGSSGICGSSVCATTCVMAQTCVNGSTIYGSSCICGTCVRGGGACFSGVMCASACAMIGTCVCAAGCIRSAGMVHGSTCVSSPIVCASTCMRIGVTDDGGTISNPVLCFAAEGTDNADRGTFICTDGSVGRLYMSASTCVNGCVCSDGVYSSSYVCSANCVCAPRMCGCIHYASSCMCSPTMFVGATNIGSCLGALHTCVGTKCGAHATAHDGCYLRCTGGTLNGSLTHANYGNGMVGLYSATRYQNVFSMGAAYQPLVDGTGLSNMYGIAWTHSNIGGQSKAGLNHQALFTNAGVTSTAIGTGIWTCGTVTAPTFVGALTGNATTATTAGASSGTLSTCLAAKCASHTHSYCAAHTHSYCAAHGHGTADVPVTCCINTNCAAVCTYTSANTSWYPVMWRSGNNMYSSSGVCISPQGTNGADAWLCASRLCSCITYASSCVLAGNCVCALQSRSSCDYGACSCRTYRCGACIYSSSCNCAVCVRGTCACFSGVMCANICSKSPVLCATTSVCATCFKEVSARCLKENICEYGNKTCTLDSLGKLKPVRYNFKKDKDTTEYGLIADDVEEVYPEFVTYDDKGNVGGLTYSKMTSVLIQGINDLNEIVKKQSEEIHELKGNTNDKIN